MSNEKQAEHERSICRGCGRADCPAPAARAAYDAEKARLDREQHEECERIRDWSKALPLIPVRERSALDDAERDCVVAHAAAWERYLATATAGGVGGNPGGASMVTSASSRGTGRLSKQALAAIRARSDAPGTPAGMYADLIALLDHAEAVEALVAWAEQKKAGG